MNKEKKVNQLLEDDGWKSSTVDDREEALASFNMTKKKRSESKKEKERKKKRDFVRFKKSRKNNLKKKETMNVEINLVS